MRLLMIVTDRVQGFNTPLPEERAANGPRWRPGAIDPLLPKHRYLLEEERGIPADILAEEGVYSLLPGDELPVPDAYFRHDNSYKAQHFPTWPSEITSGIVFPHR